jgi:hypothetical protein
VNDNDIIKQLRANDPHGLLDADKIAEDSEAIKLYLDWWNNFITLGAFADYYGMTEHEALTMINVGRKENEDKAKLLQGGAE